MNYEVTGILLGPLLYIQGRTVRRSTPVLPEPDGLREGTSGNGAGLRLLILGDSAAAGVGAPTMHESLAGQLVSRISKSRTVTWRLVARTGATTVSTLRHLKKHKIESYEVCITSLGVNDVTSGIGIKLWLSQQAELRQKLRDQLGIKKLVVCGLPPVHGFPSLPQPLRWWLGARATAFNSALKKEVANESDVAFLSLRFTENQKLMAPDGFHPGPEVYREWAMRAAKVIDPAAV